VLTQKRQHVEKKSLMDIFMSTPASALNAFIFAEG